MSHPMLYHFDIPVLWLTQQKKHCEKALQVCIDTLSFVVFKILDYVDQVLCVVFRFLDFAIERREHSCYCHFSRVVGHRHFEEGGTEAKNPGVDNRMKTEFWKGVSNSLFERDHIKSKKICDVDPEIDVLSCVCINPSRDSFQLLQMLKGEINNGDMNPVSSILNPFMRSKAKTIKSEDYPNKLQRARWSDCSCKSCTDSQFSISRMLYVVEHRRGTTGTCSVRVDNTVLFLHGFLSSSSLWVENVLPYLSESIQTSYQLLAIDLLGFGKSPKPFDCFYTLADHVEAIRKSVFGSYAIKSLHLVGHSMGCIVALALAAELPELVKSVTLISLPYFSAPSPELTGRYVMCQIAPKKVWPLLAFGCSVMSWYEHVGRVVCFILCKNHRFWEPPLQLFAGIAGIPKSLFEDLMHHTHHSAWHIFHNTICGANIDRYMQIIYDVGCEVTVIHGRKDTLCPIKCGYKFQAKYPKVHLHIVENVGHHTAVAGRKHVIAKELEGIWAKATMRKL